MTQPTTNQWHPIETAPKDGTVIVLQFISGLLHEDRRAHWSDDAFGWMYEARLNEWDMVPHGWSVQYWRPIS